MRLLPVCREVYRSNTMFRDHCKFFRVVLDRVPWSRRSCWIPGKFCRRRPWCRLLRLWIRRGPPSGMRGLGC